MQVISLGYGQFRSPGWLDKLGLPPAERKTYEYLAIAAKGQDHAWPSQKWLADKVRVTTRSIRTYIRKLEERNLLMTVLERINGRLRLVYYFLAHPVVKAAVERKNFPVKEEKFSGHLTNRKENIKLPPYPPQKEAADAAKERRHEQNETETTTSVLAGFYQSPQLEEGVQAVCQHAHGNRRTPVYEKNNGRPTTSGQATPGSGGQLQHAGRYRTGGAGTGTERLNYALWQAALALLLQKLPQQEVNLWLVPIQALESEKGLRLDCPDKYTMAWVQEHFGKSIKDVLQHLGITEFYFSFGEQEKKLQEEKNQEQRAEAAQRAADQAHTLRNLPLREQFAALLAVYPRKTSGEWFAWQTFKRLKRKGELPETSELLQMIEAKTQTEDWSRDAGRWIPGLSKWLNNRPWWKIDCKERGKESHEATLRGGKGSICCEYR